MSNVYQQKIEARALAAFNRSPVPAGASRLQPNSVTLEGDIVHVGNTYGVLRSYKVIKQGDGFRLRWVRK